MQRYFVANTFGDVNLGFHPVSYVKSPYVKSPKPAYYFRKK